MQEALLDFENSDIPAKSISPLLELGAYELLFLEHGASFKTLATKMQKGDDALPSESVNTADALKRGHQVLDVLAKRGVKQFGFVFIELGNTLSSCEGFGTL